MLHAIAEVFRRRIARKRPDAQEWMASRVWAAVQASGLERAAYLEVIGTADEALSAAIHAAFDDLAQEHAKREALRRAYASSGCSVEEFAQRYGMDIATVQRAVTEPAPAQAEPAASAPP